MAKDFSSTVAMLLGYCSQLPDLTPEDYTELGLWHPCQDVTATDAGHSHTPGGQGAPTLIQMIAPEVALPAAPEVSNKLSDEEEAWAFDMFMLLPDLIAGHYGFDADEVWAVLWDIEADVLASCGMPWLARSTQHPFGIAALGCIIAKQITGLPAEMLPEPIHILEH